MTTVLRPVTFCVVLLFGAGPAVAVACELACTSPSGHSGHHDGHHDAATHEHSTAMGDRASSEGEGALLSTGLSNCDHDAVGSPALASSGVKVFAPMALDVPDTAVTDVPCTLISSVGSCTASPPGVRSGSPPLRI